jgi:predicted DNA-binding transcriptional regulator AlpA
MFPLNSSASAQASDPPIPGAPADLRLIRLPEALSVVGLKRSAWLDLVRAGRAPQPVKLGRATAWLSCELQSWICERVREARGL